VRNIELKLELRDAALARAVVVRLGGKRVARLVQTDTYFRLASGRLKRREQEGEEGPLPVEYIHYERADAARVRPSDFTILSESEALTRFGTLAMPIWVVVKKEREVYMVEWTRVHLDRVDRLGTFLEFESLVAGKNDEAACRGAVARLREALGPALGEPLSLSYADLLAAEPDPVMGADPPG
jgi:adenylate cyclase class IV